MHFYQLFQGKKYGENVEKTVHVCGTETKVNLKSVMMAGLTTL